MLIFKFIKHIKVQWKTKKIKYIAAKALLALKISVVILFIIVMLAISLFFSAVTAALIFNNIANFKLGRFNLNENIKNTIKCLGVTFIMSLITLALTISTFGISYLAIKSAINIKKVMH